MDNRWIPQSTPQNHPNHHSKQKNFSANPFDFKTIKK
jgi:hypothetical protein